MIARAAIWLLSNAINMPLPVNGSMKEAASPMASNPGTGESSRGVSVDRPPVPLSGLSQEQCRQVEQRSVIGAGEETIGQLEQCRLVLRPLFRFVEHGRGGEYLAPGDGLAFFLPLVPCSLRMEVSNAAF